MEDGRIKKRLVVIGGGFAGLNFVTQLFNNNYYDVTLVDRNNYNYFTPLIYQVATSFLEPASISYPFRKYFRKKDIAFRMASAEGVDTTSGIIYLSDGGTIGYDIVVFAAGCKTNFFGNENIRENAFSLKGVDDALNLRNELIKTMERAAIESNPAERQKLLTIVIAGGGPTGVEIAGMLAEMDQHILRDDYPQLRDSSAMIYIVDGSANLLSPMSEKSHADAKRALTRRGVRIVLNTHVDRYEKGVVQLSDGRNIEAGTLIWAAGVTPNLINGIAEQSFGRGKRMITDKFNRVNGYDNIYAIGDQGILFDDPAYPNGHPQLAQPAIQQGKRLADNLLRAAKGKPMKPFIYFDRGDMAIIGRTTAVADLFKNKIHFRGLAGLLSWLLIHLISLVNYNNRIRTLYSWTVSYLTKDQVLRMVFRSGGHQNGRG
jgi:NADH dehydrogenase